MKRILIVDDEQELLDLAREFLEAKDFEVETCSTAGSALDLLGSAERFDAIISDVRMPDMSGPRFLSELKQRKLLVNPFVFLTGYGSDDPEVQALYDNGLDRVFTKPVFYFQLAEYIDQYIKKAEKARA